LALQIAASSAFTSLLANTGRVITTLRVIKDLASGVLAPVTGGVSIAAALASEVAIIAFQQWLQSPTGKKALAWIIVYLVDPVSDWILDLSWRPLMKFLGAQDDKPEDKKKADDDAKKKADDEAKKKADDDRWAPNPNIPQPTKQDQPNPTSAPAKTPDNSVKNDKILSLFNR
jgi:hypothetical protein